MNIYLDGYYLCIFLCEISVDVMRLRLIFGEYCISTFKLSFHTIYGLTSRHVYSMHIMVLSCTGDLYSRINAQRGVFFSEEQVRTVSYK